MNNTTFFFSDTTEQFPPHSPDTEEIRRKIAIQKQRMQEREIGDDGYYLSRQYQEDIREIYELEQSVKELSHHKKEITPRR